MPIVGAFIVPHGAMILDPSREKVNTMPLHQGMLKVAAAIASLKPDVIFLTTPHSITLNEAFGLYMNKNAVGSAEWENQYQEFSVNVDLDQSITKDLYQSLLSSQQKVEGITCFSPSVGSAMFRWGEAVPLWFLRNLKNVKYVVMSQPIRRYHPLPIIDELVSLGHHLHDYFQNLSQRVVILISGDLAHTHQKGLQYEFAPEAEPFDAAIAEWTKTLSWTTLIDTAGPLVEKAMTCGFAGFVMLHGILESLNVSKKLLVRGHPTYYGMLVSQFICL